MIKTAVALVGGEALRLRPLTENIPKAMVQVAGKPIIGWIIDWLKESGIENLILGVDYKKEVIIDYLKDGRDLGITIKYNVHTGAGGTGDAFRLAIENCGVQDKLFLAMNGDELTDVSIKNMLRFHNEYKPVATIMACQLMSPFGILSIDDDNRVTSFREKPLIRDYFVNAGVYIFDQRIRAYLPEKGAIETMTFVKLAEEGQLRAFKYHGFWSTVNTPKDLRTAEERIQLARGLE